jgi:diguanylate cyclase (GGDEF)-like protein/PAS domain S-box-containing protein
MDSANYERAYRRERQAREHAEELIEDKSRELYFINQELQKSIKIISDKEAETAAILETAADAILMFDETGHVILCNYSAERVFGYSREEILRSNIINFLQFNAALSKNISKVLCFLDSLNATSIVELKAVTKDQKFFPIEFSASSIELTKGRFYILIIRDITERKLLEEQLEHQATHDALTGLPNRLLLMDRLQQAVLSAEREKKLVAVVFFDLDRFKMINDTHGHDIGDALLKEVAQRIKKIIRKSDTFARMGGDEFVIILRSLADEKACLPVLQKILACIAKPFYIRDIEINTSTSIGISVFPEGGKTAQTLLKNADAAMYRSKELGRNTFNFFNKNMNERLRKRMELESFLHKALKNHEFLLHYQPIYCLRTKKIVGVEALIRWQHPKLGLVPPQQFIPLAEETGLILPLGEWVIRQACAQTKKWHNAGYQDLHVSINVSAHQLKRTSIVQTLQKICEETNIAPSFVNLELTESSILEDIESAQKILKSLKELGVNLVIDDFGTGYSSLTYLQKLPVSLIKIDRSFINYITNRSEDVAIVLSIISMAHNLGLKVVAEGIEKLEQQEFLEKHHCDMVQGFYFCYPLAAEKISLVLATTNK